MSFIPYVHVPQPPPPSARAQELSRQLAEVIEHYRREHPSTSDAEIRQALGLSAANLGTNTAPAAVIVGLVLALFGGIALFFFSKGGSLPNAPWVLVALLVGLGIAVAAIVAVIRNRS